MKKALLIFLPLLITPMLVGCESSGEYHQLSYGTYAHNEAIEITAGDLISKKEKENFLLAAYGDTTCGCWVYFSRLIDLACANNNLLIYKIDSDEFDDDLRSFGFKKSDDPAFYIVSNKKIIKSYYYAENPDVFGIDSKFMDAVKEHIKLPYIYYIDEEQLEEKVKGTSIIYYMRGKCSDCSYTTPNVLLKYAENKTFNNKIYAFDMDPIRDESSEVYQAFKDQYFLSTANNAALGYDTGYVPTFHYYLNGELKDAAVYFNDEISDGKISHSYYSEARKNNLHYLDKLENKVLEGISLKEDEIKDGRWISRDVQNKYYKPFLEAFLDTYLR